MLMSIAEMDHRFLIHLTFTWRMYLGEGIIHYLLPTVFINITHIRKHL